jgi:hypothetical protein
MKCIRFPIRRLPNETWAQFYAAFRDLAQAYGVKELDIEELFATFLLLYGQADKVLELIRKSAFTEKLDDADRKRDAVFRGLTNAVKSACDHFDPAKKEAARLLQIVIDHYGNLTRKPHDEATASINNFIQDMQAGGNTDAVEKLGLAEWLLQLRNDNKAFDTLMHHRDSEAAHKTKLNMATVRSETDNCYRNILDRLDALMLLNGDEKYALFVNELNVRAERYANTLARRKGKKKSPPTPEGGEVANNDNE